MRSLLAQSLAFFSLIFWVNSSFCVFSITGDSVVPARSFSWDWNYYFRMHTLYISSWTPFPTNPPSWILYCHSVASLEMWELPRTLESSFLCLLYLVGHQVLPCSNFKSPLVRSLMKNFPKHTQIKSLFWFQFSFGILPTAFRTHFALFNETCPSFQMNPLTWVLWNDLGCPKPLCMGSNHFCGLKCKFLAPGPTDLGTSFSLKTELIHPA